jgi:predicted phage tail protein
MAIRHHTHATGRTAFLAGRGVALILGGLLLLIAP